MKTKLLLYICLLMAVVSSKAQDENLSLWGSKYYNMKE